MRHKLNHASAALDRGQFVRGMDVINFHKDLHGDTGDDKEEPNPDTPSCPAGEIAATCEGDVIGTNPGNIDDETDEDDSDEIWSDTQNFNGIQGLASGALGRLGQSTIYGIPFFKSAQLLQGETFFQLSLTLEDKWKELVNPRLKTHLSIVQNQFWL